MFLKKTYSKNHTYLSLTETFREDGKVKHRTIAQLGRLDELLANSQLKRLVYSFERLLDIEKKVHLCDLEEIDNPAANDILRILKINIPKHLSAVNLTMDTLV